MQKLLPAFFLAIGFVSVYPLEGNPIFPDNIVSLGQVNGKYFFYDKTNGTWQESRALCITAGMTLAEISTTEELKFLKNKYSARKFSWVFWTAGRDAGKHEQFVWDRSQSSIDTVIPFYDFEPEHTCVTFSVRYWFDHGKLRSRDCTKRYQSLCQTI